MTRETLAGGSYRLEFDYQPPLLTVQLLGEVAAEHNLEMTREYWRHIADRVAASGASALLVLDVQPQLAASVYGREILQQARQDPWTQMAVLQASGQAPRPEGARQDGAGLCDTPGCPYAARAPCVQPFCPAVRGTPPAAAALPA